MIEERGQIAGNQIVSEAYTLWGSIAGEVVVIDGGKMYVRGAIYGDLTVEEGGRVHVFGNISGKLSVILRKGAVFTFSAISAASCR